MVFMADFLFRALAQLFTFLKDPHFNNRPIFLKKVKCCICVGYKKCDVKTIEVVASGTR
jgi:hypothetical protein